MRDISLAFFVNALNNNTNFYTRIIFYTYATYSRSRDPMKYDCYMNSFVC